MRGVGAHRGLVTVIGACYELLVSPAKQAFGLIGWLSLCFAAAVIGALASIRASEFYGQLTQPSWAPPASLFGPVWTVLYGLMAIAAWLIWRKSGFRPHALGLTLFIVQLGANAIWTWLFFDRRQGAWALADIVLLAALIATTLVAFWKAHKVAAVLLMPYLAWVTYASALNWALLKLNPQILG